MPIENVKALRTRRDQDPERGLETGRGGLAALQKPATLVLIALGVRILFLFLSHNTGTDSWARYIASLEWAQHPDHIPSEVWLPLPFWILGAVLRFFPSEAAARLFTILLGSLTILPFYGVAKKLCSPSGAFYASVVYACLGLHIGYSVSTSSETPTLLFLIGGIYAWVRFRTSHDLKWFSLSALGLNAAALCRYEIWAVIPVIALLFIIDRGPETSNPPLSKRLLGGVLYGAAASISSVGWSLFCLWKWGDPLAPAHQTVWLNAHRPLELQPGSLHRFLAVPADLFGSLGPIVVVLSVIGIIIALSRRDFPRWDLAIIVLAMAGFHAYNALAHGATMARYTLMYSWLVIMFCFYGLERLSVHWSSSRARAAAAFTVASFVLWQAALVVGAERMPCRIADKLGSISATVPLRCELRQLLSFLNTNLSASDSVVVDDMGWESTDLIRFSKIATLKYFQMPYLTGDTAALLTQFGAFVQANHPEVLVYSPKGQLGRLWRLPSGEARQSVSGVNIQLCEIWQNGEYRVYRMTYDHPCSSSSVSNPGE